MLLRVYVFIVCSLLIVRSKSAHSLRNRQLQESVNDKEHHHAHNHIHNGTWDCNRPWPSLTLFLPFKIIEDTHNPRYYEIENVFFRTLLLYWPLQLSNTSLLLVYDDESRNSPFVGMVRETMGALVNWRVPGGSKMIGIPPFPYYNSGYNRQQYNMFWADNFTDTEYIGFVDTDTAFVTYVDREDLFEDGKPVINGRSGWRSPYYGLSAWIRSDYFAMQLLEPMICMSYFPVIIKAAHLKGLREYLEKLWNISFDEAFHTKIEAGNFSQFGIMCIYLWHFHRDEYVWYTHSETPGWDGVNPAPPIGMDANLSQFTPQMKLPKPRIACHFNHRNPKKHAYMSDLRDPNAYREYLRKGYCYSPPFPHTEPFCAGVDPLKYYGEMHNFDEFCYEDVTTPELMNAEAVKRHERLKHCTHKYEQSDLNYFF